MSFLVQRTMLGLFPTLELDRHLITCLRCAESVDEALPDITDRQRGGVHEVVGIEPIIT